MTSITDILDSLGIPFREGGTHRHVTANFIGVDCPSCSPGSNSFKFGIPKGSRSVGSCWSCGTMPLTDALAELSGVPWQKIKEMLGNVEETERTEKPKGRLVIPCGIGPLAKAHVEYLRSRGFASRTLEQLWGVQGIGIAPRLSWRIFIKIQHQGKTVSWTTRSISHTNPKRYIAARADEEAMPAKSILFGSDFARHSILVVEGHFSVFRIGPGCVAVGGVGYTRAQLAKIAAYPVRYIAFDSTSEAQERARKLCDELSPFSGRTYRVELDAAQPDQAGPKELSKLRRLLK